MVADTQNIAAELPTGLPLPKGYSPAYLSSATRGAWSADIRSQPSPAYQRVTEWKWYCRNLRYAIEDLLWIKNQERQIVPTRLTGIQRDIIAHFVWDWLHGIPIRYIIGPKPRRIGASTVVSEILHLLTRFQRNSQSLIMMNNGDTTDMVFRWHKLFNEYIARRAKLEIEGRGGSIGRKGQGLAKHALYLPTTKDNERLIQWYDFNPDMGENGDWFDQGGSYIRMVTGGSAKGAVGDAFQFIHYGEVGDDQVDWDAQTKANDRGVPLPSITPYTAIIREGSTYLDDTSQVVSGVYLQKIVDEAREGKSEYRHLFYGWFDHDFYRLALEPGEKVEVFKGFRNMPDTKARDEREIADTRTLIWKNWRIAEMSEPMKSRLIQECEDALNCRQKVLLPETEGDIDWFHSQYPAYTDQAFVARTQKYFDINVVNERLETCRANPFGKVEDDWLITFREPEPNTEYVITADPSSGSGDDLAGALVFNTKRFSIDAAWQGRETTAVQAEEWTSLGYRYCYRELDQSGTASRVIPALFVPEANSIGNEVIRIARDELNYPNIWRRKPLDRKLGKQQRGEYGFWTEGRSGGGGQRDSALSQAKLQWMTWEIYDERILRQMANFGFKKGSNKPQAKVGGDEFITCMWILAYVCAILGYVKEESPDEKWVEAVNAKTSQHDLDTLLTYLGRALSKARMEEGADAKVARLEGKIAEIHSRRTKEVRTREPWRAWFNQQSGTSYASGGDWRVRGLL